MRMVAALAMLVALGACNRLTELPPPDTHGPVGSGQAGILVFGSEGPLVEIPRTAVRGDTAVIRVSTYGFCDQASQVTIEAGETAFSGASPNYTLRPMDYAVAVAPGTVCTSALRLFAHDITTVFPEVGIVQVNVIGRSWPANRQYVVNAQVVVTPRS